MQRKTESATHGGSAERPTCLVQDIAAVHYYVDDLKESFDFFVEVLDLCEVGRSSPSLEAETGEQSVVFQLGDASLVVTSPLRDDSQSARFSSRHIDGIGKLSFRVPHVSEAFDLLTSHGATALGEPLPAGDSNDETFEIATPIDNFRFAFVSTRWDRGEILPGFIRSAKTGRGTNTHGFKGLDHVTFNFMTIEPAILWFEKVLGLEKFWSIDLHTGDPTKSGIVGSGLRSVVMTDPLHRIKLASNEPRYPNFAGSQIFDFCEQHHGSGVQHIAIVVPDIVRAVERLRARGVRFQATPASYYQALSSQRWLPAVREIIEDLERQEILLDGSDECSYLLQVFMTPGGKHGRWESRSPFFLELIQREGCGGFGEGNFRALFESIEASEPSTWREIP